MNLYLHVRLAAIESYQIPGYLQKKARPAMIALRQSHLPAQEQERAAVELVQKLHEPGAEENAEQITTEAKADYEKRKRAVWLDWIDALLFIPLWIVLKQIGINELLDPIMAHAALPQMMRWGLANLLSAFGVYLVVKLLVYGAMRWNEGWKRWLLIFGCLAAFLGADLLSRLALPSIEISPWILALVCAVIFVLALAWHRQLFDEGKNEPRVS